MLYQGKLGVATVVSIHAPIYAEKNHGRPKQVNR